MEATSTARPNTGLSGWHDPAWIDVLRDRLLAHAFLFDDPRGYEAGVEDSLKEVEAFLRATEP